MQKINHQELQASGHQFARMLDDSGVQRRGTVAVLLPNCVEFLYCLRGATWSGRTFTPVNWHLTPKDIEYIVADSEADAFVVHVDFADIAQAVALHIPEACRFAVGGEIPGYQPFNDIQSYSGEVLAAPLAGAVMMYTSGTTGRPRGVKPAAPKDAPPPCFSSAAGMMLLSHYLEDERSGTHLVAGPLYHAAPSTYAEGASLLGQDVVIMERWDAEEFLRQVEQEKITSVFLVPTHFVRLLQLPDDVRNSYDVSSLQFVCHGAAPVTQDVKRQMIDWLGPVLFEFYGGTEGGGISISSQEWLEHPGSVGKPRPDQVVYILDDEGNPCDSGAVGNIYFKAAEQQFEYKDDPEKTAAAYRGDKYTLGDMGYVDADGYLYLSDRKSDTIISGGVNIYPAEVEAILVKHPAVRDSCVVSVLDAEWGERVVAAVQLHNAFEERNSLLEDIEAHCRANLASYQVPRQFICEHSLPRTETGKLQRRILRDEYRARGPEL